MLHFKNNPSHQETNSIISPKLFDVAYSCIKTWNGYSPSPLHYLNGLAESLGVKQIYYKDESERFGLKSFKALGGAYAVACVLRSYLKKILPNVDIQNRDILSGKYSDLLKEIISCNSPLSYNDGNYDDSVDLIKQDAIKNNWQIISDTSYVGYTDIPKFVMAGYTVMTQEIFKQLDNELIPTHIIIQGGVGGLAASICAHSIALWGSKRPKFIVVEPETADCLYQSAILGKPKMVQIEKETLMGGLSCGEVSLIGWDILKNNTNDFITISDDNVRSAMRLMAKGVCEDPSIEAGESAVAGIAMLMELENLKKIKSKLNIDESSRILLFGTEGATDQNMYDQIIIGN